MKAEGNKRIICAIVAIMASMMMFSGCGGSADAETASYEEIIGKYAEIIESRGDLSDYTVEEDINVELFSAVAGFDGWNIYYTEKDIDNNGINELLISGGFDTDETINYLIYTMDENGAVDLFPDYVFGARANFTVYEDGVIEVEGSNNAEDVVCEYYKAGGDVTSIEPMDSETIEGSDLVEMEFEWKQL